MNPRMLHAPAVHHRGRVFVPVPRGPNQTELATAFGHILAVFERIQQHMPARIGLATGPVPRENDLIFLPVHAAPVTPIIFLSIIRRVPRIVRYNALMTVITILVTFQLMDYPSSLEHQT